VEDSESAKQKTQVWQPGSAQALFGVKANHKDFLNQKFLWMPVNHLYWWGCQR